MKITEGMSEPVRAQFMFGSTMLVGMIGLLLLYLHRLANGDGASIQWYGWLGLTLAFIGSSMQILGALALTKRDREMK